MTWFILAKLFHAIQIFFCFPRICFEIWLTWNQTRLNGGKFINCVTVETFVFAQNYFNLAKFLKIEKKSNVTSLMNSPQSLLDKKVSFLTRLNSSSYRQISPCIRLFQTADSSPLTSSYRLKRLDFPRICKFLFDSLCFQWSGLLEQAKKKCYKLRQTHKQGEKRRIGGLEVLTLFK